MQSEALHFTSEYSLFRFGILSVDIRQAGLSDSNLDLKLSFQGMTSISAQFSHR